MPLHIEKKWTFGWVTTTPTQRQTKKYSASQAPEIEKQEWVQWGWDLIHQAKANVFLQDFLDCLFQWEISF